jgi:hypothetical protein
MPISCGPRARARTNVRLLSGSRGGRRPSGALRLFGRVGGMRGLGGSRARIHVHLPDQCSRLKHRSETRRSNKCRHALRRMDEHSEAGPAKPQLHVQHRDHRPHRAPITRIAVGKEPTRFTEGQSKKVLIIRITTDHAIQGDNVRARQGGRRSPDIVMDELDTAGVSPPPCLGHVGFQEGRRRLHRPRPRYAAG